MKFSILVPVYNVEKYLEQCVESLLDQTYTGEYEIILVDDGSTDSSGEICDKYAQAHPEKVRVVHKPNGGHTSARLEAIKNAMGEYSLFCDSDDFVENSLLESIERVLNNNPDTDMVMYSFCYYENGKKIPRKFALSESEKTFVHDKKELYEALIFTPYINSLWTKAIRTDFLKNDTTDYGILKDKDIAEDAYTVSHFFTVCKKIVSITEPLYNYRTNQSSISRSADPNKIGRKNTLFLYQRYKELLPLWGMDTEEYRRKLDARWLNEVMYTFRQYYEHAETAKDRKVVLAFDWSSMLPEDVRNCSENPFESKASRKIYTLVSKKKRFRLNLYFAYNRYYKNYRKLKSRLLNK